MEIYKQYAELIQASKILDAQLEEVKALIFDDMKKLDVKSSKQEFGTFTITQRKKLSYSDNVKALEENVKIAKIEEEEQGIATIEINEFLSFRG